MFRAYYLSSDVNFALLKFLLHNITVYLQKCIGRVMQVNWAFQTINLYDFFIQFSFLVGPT